MQTSLSVEKLRELIANAPAGSQVWFGLNEGPIVAIEDVDITTDPEDKPCIILFEKDEE